MGKWFWSVVGVLGAFLTLKESAAVVATETKKSAGFLPVYKKYGEKYGVPPQLLRAIAIVESGEDPNAKNPADPSYGLMQIYYTGSNKFNIDGWPPPNKEALFDPEYNVSLAAQILAWNLKTYGFRRGIAVYNSWGARNDPTDGPFRNQVYVDKVLENYNVG